MDINKDKKEVMSNDKNTKEAQPKKSAFSRFFREIGSAFGMALIAIIYVIQAFQIPTGSMENSLLVGDFLLGLKFVYGAPVIPFSQELGVTARLPALRQPTPGDVVIFKYPGADRKDYIKRMVAGPGDVIEFVNNTTLYVNGLIVSLPPKGKYAGIGRIDRRITDFAPLYIPAAGDTLHTKDLPVREFMFLRNLIHQENPTRRVRMIFDLYINGELANDRRFNFNGMQVSLADLQAGRVNILRYETHGRLEPLDFNRFDDWTVLENILDMIRGSFAETDVRIEQSIVIDNSERVESYVVKFDNYFMVGDNRDNSLDSRYWGYLNYNFVKAQALILYFSYDGTRPVWQFPTNIRWNRIGKLIRGWDGVTEHAAGIKY